MLLHVPVMYFYDTNDDKNLTYKVDCRRYFILIVFRALHIASSN